MIKEKAFCLAQQFILRPPKIRKIGYDRMTSTFTNVYKSFSHYSLLLAKRNS